MNLASLFSSFCPLSISLLFFNGMLMGIYSYKTGTQRHYFWNKLIKNAKIRNLEFNISMEYVWYLFNLQHEKCALSGVKIFFPKTIKKSGTVLSLIKLKKVNYIGLIHSLKQNLMNMVN